MTHAPHVEPGLSLKSTSLSAPGRISRTVAIVGAVWYAFGLMQFWLAYTLDPAAAVASGSMTAAHGAAIVATPAVIWLCFAIASGAGLFGTIQLFRGAAGAVPCFIISLFSAAVFYTWVYGLSGSGSARPTQEAYIAVVVVAVTAAFLVYSLLARRKLN